MATTGGRPRAAIQVRIGLGDIAPRADDAHMVLWSRSLHRREETATDVTAELNRMGECQVVTLAGAVIHDLNSLRAALDEKLPADDGSAMKATIDGPVGLLARLRQAPRTFADGRHIKYRYFVWRDADVLLRASPEAFAVFVDAVAGVAMESEFDPQAMLLIQRLFLIGGPALERCFHDAHGPLRAWRPGSPWHSKTHIAAPKFQCHEIPRTNRLPVAIFG